MLETWRANLVTDSSTGDSDKTFTVTARRQWQVLWIFVTYATKVGGTAGARRLEIDILDTASNIVLSQRTDTSQSSDVTRYYLFAPGAADLASFRDTDFISHPLPTILLPEGYQIRLFDSAAVAADSDDMEIRMMVQQKGDRRRLISAANEEPSS